MGIYSDGFFYGIKCERYDNDEKIMTVFQKKYSDKMTAENRVEVAELVKILPIEEGYEYIFYYLTYCSSTHECSDPVSWMTWMKISHIQLHKYLNNE